MDANPKIEAPVRRSPITYRHRPEARRLPLAGLSAALAMVVAAVALLTT